MKTAAQTTFAERLGRMLGRAWRRCAHLDRRAQGWLLARGWAPGAAKATLLAAKLVAFSLLLYAAFWLALLLLIVVAVGWAMDQHHPAEDGFELQYPTIEELRNSPGYDPNLHNDTSHEMYQDD